MLGRTSLVRGLADRAQQQLSALRQKHSVVVVLSGNGVYDGTEVHEAAAAVAALTRGGAKPIFVAPDVNQAHVVDHTSGSEMKEERSVIKESSRIAREAVQSLATLKASSDVAAVLFPGGFGAAKNLSDFGFKGADMTVNPEVARVIKEFHAAGKPIALCCIAPILAAKVLGSKGVRLTMGRKGDESKWPHGGAIDAAQSFGATMVDMDVGEVCVDDDNKIVSSPAFMYNGEFHEIQDGVGNMVRELLKMIK